MGRLAAADLRADPRQCGACAVPGLTRLLKSDVYSIRAAAAEALGRIGPDAKTAVPALIETLKDEHAHPRRHAAEALKKIDAAAAKRAAGGGR